jgi:GNAT superfamily N-acetyltransferase/ketosteroid isomerase-like protein
MKATPCYPARLELRRLTGMSHGVSSASATIEEMNRAVLARFFHSWSAGDVDAVMQCVTKTFVYRASIGPDPGKTYSGADGVRAGIVEMLALDADRVAVITDQHIHGNMGFTRWAYRWPSPAACVSDELGCDWIQFRDGLLESKDAYRKVMQRSAVPVPHAVSIPAAGIRAPGESARLAGARDAEPLLQLMHKLAEFENYRPDFRVGFGDLLARGLAASQDGQFKAFVTDSGTAGLSGYAVVQEVSFTFDLRPTLILKELFVSQDWRGQGVGTALMSAVLDYARARGCGRLRWDVLPGNEAAKRFYRRFGGDRDSAWEN